MSQERFWRGVTLDDDWTSDPITPNAPRTCIDIYINNTDLVGSITVQQRNSENENWKTIGFKDENEEVQTSYTISSGTDVDHAWEYEGAAGQLRLNLTHTSGEGVLIGTVSTRA